MYHLKSSKADYSLDIPTNPNEITPVILQKLLKNINLSKNYAVVALRYKVDPFELIMGSKSAKQGVQASVVPILAKYNGELNGALGDRVSISASALEMGLHINGVTKISVNNVKDYINSHDALSKSVINRTAFADTKFIYLLEFKIVSFNDIKALIKNEDKDDPFVIVDDE